MILGGEGKEITKNTSPEVPSKVALINRTERSEYFWKVVRSHERLEVTTPTEGMDEGEFDITCVSLISWHLDAWQ